MAASWTFYGEASTDWREDDELHRPYDRVIPELEIRFVEPPDDATLEVLAQVTEREARETDRVLWSGPFSLWLLPATSLEGVVRLARRFVDALHAVAPVREVVFFAVDRHRHLDPGPAWPNLRIRNVDRDLPLPSARTAFDRARAALRAAAAPPQIPRVAALLGPPREVPGLADAIAKAGTPIRDFEGGEHVVARVTRFNFGTKAKPSHVMLGLVATGQWAVVQSFETERHVEQRPRNVRPAYIAMAAHRPTEHRAQIRQGLATLGVDAPFPERELLIAELRAADNPPTGLDWIGPDLVPLDAELRALLEPRRAEPRIAAVLDARPAKPKPKKKKR